MQCKIRALIRTLVVCSILKKKLEFQIARLVVLCIYKTWFHTDFMPKLKLDANVEKILKKLSTFFKIKLNWQIHIKNCEK